MNTEEIRISLKPQWWWPLAGGVLLGIALRAIYSGQPGGAYDAMSGSFALLAPIAVSAVTVYIAELRDATHVVLLLLDGRARQRVVRHRHLPHPSSRD